MSGKIKICHVINAFENGGAEAVILNYISHMNRSRFEFHVISHGVVSQVCEKKFHDLGFIVHLIPSKKHPLKHVGEMYKICKKEQFDILHIATTEWAFIAGFVGMAAGCKHRINHSHMAECPQGFLSKITFHVKVLLCFAQQVNGYGKAGDVFLGISTSGNSKNILFAATTAHAKGLKVIGLTGAKDSKLKDMSDVCIKASQTETYMIQELHLPIYHCLCLMLEDKFFTE